MKVMYQDFLDILVCSDIIFKPIGIEEPKESKYATAGTMNVSVDISDITSYQAEISFRQFLTSEDQLEYEVFYFENNDVKNPKSLELKSQKVTIHKMEGEVPKALIDFSLYKRDLRKNNAQSYILFVCRLRLEEKKYYPISINTEERYIGAMIKTEEKVTVHYKGLFNKKEFKESNHQAPVAINTLPKLKSKEAWKNSFRRRVNN